MASIISVPCRFFAQGACKNGASCKFIHEKPSSTQSISLEAWSLASLGAQLPIMESPTVAHNFGYAKCPQPCRFFSQGLCHYGDTCRNEHASTESRFKLQQSTASEEIPASEEVMESSRVPSDSRSSIPCRFFSRPGGCHNDSCSYLHVEHAEDKRRNEDVQMNEDEVHHLFFGASLELTKM